MNKVKIVSWHFALMPPVVVRAGARRGKRDTKINTLENIKLCTVIEC